MPPIIPRTSGIYVIANTKNGKVYIGKTANGFEARWKEHRKRLNGNYHHNSHLQSAWNKYGAKAFKFYKLEYCSNEQLNEREMHHIAIYKLRGMCYNQTDGGDGQLGNSPNAETRAKLSDAHKGKKRPPFSSETREKLSVANTGKVRTPEMVARMSLLKKGKPLSPKTREGQIRANSKKWIITKPNGVVLEVTNLKAFCRENKLDPGSMYNVSSRKFNRYKGWKCRHA